MTKTFHCTEDKSNKLWEYQTQGDTKVLIRYGRVGGHITEDSKSFDSVYRRDEFIQMKTNEKLKKGYKETTAAKIADETKTAQTLGIMYKIANIQWVTRMGNRLTIQKTYDPSKWVYVEILNSWSKEKTYLVLNKNEAFGIVNPQPDGGTIKYSSTTSAPTQFVLGIKEHIKKLFKKVNDIVIQKVASLGKRKLDLGDASEDDEDITTNTAVFNDIVTSVGDGVDYQVISKFAALGKRCLDL